MRTWARHYQAAWQERAANRRLPLWLRVTALAYGCHAANGHASFKPGELALILGTPNLETGEVRPVDKNNLQRSIRIAVEHEWLAVASGSLCLVVPGNAIDTLLKGHDKPCDRHGKVGQKVTHLEGEGGSESDPPGGQNLTHPRDVSAGRRAAPLRVSSRLTAVPNALDTSERNAS